MNFCDYRIEDLLSESELEQAHRAEHETLHQPVFLRRWNAARLAEFEDPAEFTNRVARFSSEVVDPHLLVVLDVGLKDGVPYTAAEFVEAADLTTFVASMGPLPLALACEYTRQAAAALRAAHAAGFVHGWLSPASLLLSPIITKTRADGSVSTRPAPGAAIKVRDVGQLPNRPSIHDRPYDPAADLGPVEYLPPERIDGSACDAASDIYGLGACLYFMLTGKDPFRGGSPIEVLLRIRQGDVEPVQSLAEGPEISDLSARMMATNSADRPSLEEVLRALEPFCSFSPPAPSIETIEDSDHHDDHPFGGDLHAESAMPVPRFGPPPGKDRTVMWIIIGSACWIVAIGGWFLMSGSAKTDPNPPPKVNKKGK